MPKTISLENNKRQNIIKIALIDKSFSNKVHSIKSIGSCKNIVIRVSFYRMFYQVERYHYWNENTGSIHILEYVLIVNMITKFLELGLWMKQIFEK